MSRHLAKKRQGTALEAAKLAHTAGSLFCILQRRLCDCEWTWDCIHYFSHHNSQNQGQRGHLDRDLSWLMVSGNRVLHGEAGRPEQLRLGWWNLPMSLLA